MGHPILMRGSRLPSKMLGMSASCSRSLPFPKWSRGVTSGANREPSCMDSRDGGGSRFLLWGEPGVRRVFFVFFGGCPAAGLSKMLGSSASCSRSLPFPKWSRGVTSGANREPGCMDSRDGGGSRFLLWGEPGVRRFWSFCFFGGCPAADRDRARPQSSFVPNAFFRFLHRGAPHAPMASIAPNSTPASMLSRPSRVQ